VGDAKPGAEGDDEGVSAREALIVSAIVVIVIRAIVPFGGTILYPFTLFATWVHEMGHGLTGLVVGGSFDKLEIFGNVRGFPRRYRARLPKGCARPAGCSVR
jgi:hypothetical protein